MPSSQAAKAKSRPDLTSEQLEHLYKHHLNIHFDEKRELLEIGWVCDCNDKSCDVPESVAFYSCKRPPCPPVS